MTAPEKGKQPDLTKPIHLRRPLNVDEAIDEVFGSPATRTAEYKSEGLDDYEFSVGVNGKKISARQEAKKLAQVLGRRISILDIGAGYGRFVLVARRDGHVAHGITAQNHLRLPLDDRPGSEIGLQLPPGSLVVGDGNRLSELNGLLPRYDMVVSHRAFIHFVDPVGSVEQALDKVAPGGLALFSQLGFDMRTDGGFDQRILIDSLSRAGFSVDSLPEDQNPESVLYARRLEGSGPVSFPASYVSYENHPNLIRYSWEPESIS